jgi:parallel beta-helix repeat protein
MKRKLWLLALVGAMLLSVNPVVADGDFYVVAVGGGVGTKITSLPYTINLPGFYYVASNLSYTGGNGIIVNADDVTIDLMGFLLSSNGSNSGIYMGARKRVEIRNGIVKGWNTGVDEANIGGSGHRVINIRAEGNTYGIYLGSDSNLVQGCTVLNNTNQGIYSYGSGTISGNIITNCGTAISCYGVGRIIGNTIVSNSGQTGILTTPNSPILLDQNAVGGDGYHYTVGGSATVWAGKSSYYPYGNNAGAP